MSIRWMFDLFSWKPSVNDLAFALNSIQAEERARVDRFVYRRDAFATLVGRLLTRSYCCKVSGISWDKLNLDRDSNGKPYLVDDKHIKFNVSHQGKYVVLAGETSNRIDMLGVDVMKQEYTGGKCLDEFFRLMDKNFAKTEWKWIRHTDNSTVRTNRFFRLWTLKESYVKATGTGITVPLDEIEFIVLTDPLTDRQFINDTVLKVGSQPQEGWSFQEMQLDSEHCVSVALHGKSNLKAIDSRNFQLIKYDDIVNLFQPIDDINSMAVKILGKPFSPSS